MDINNFFQTRRNQFAKQTLQVLFRANPYFALFERKQFDMELGITPTVRTLTHELPTSYPTSLSAVGVDPNIGAGGTLVTGQGDPYCAPNLTAQVINRGELQRTWQLYQTAFKTNTICLSDLKRAEQAAEAVAGFEKALREYITVWWSDWSRLQAIAMVSNKVSVTSSSALTVHQNDTNPDFSGVSAIPTQTVNWTILDQIYLNLVRSGVADEYAIGHTESGMPVLPLILSPGYKQLLFRDDSDKREQIKFSEMGSSTLTNLKALGYDKAINGFLPIVDVFPMRFGKTGGISAVSDLSLANAIYPTVNADATLGRMYSSNPNYLPVSRGGLAQFEVLNILPRNVFEAQFEPSSPSAFSGMEFTPQNYVGEFQWVNNKTFNGDNDLGQLGYYFSQIRVGAKPLFPQFGYSILANCPQN
jgi:hypothetical protein